MKTRCLFLLFLANFICSSSFSQRLDYNGTRYECYDDSCLFVTSLSGIKLRKEPAFKSSVLAAIPFGEIVKPLQKVWMSPDDWSAYRERLEYTSDSIPGNWINVEYKGKAGYCFNAYLSMSLVNMTSPYYLLYDETGCNVNTYLSPKYSYYGFFKSKDLSYTIKKVKPICISEWDDYGRTDITADTLIKPAFMIASLSPLKEGITTGIADSTAFIGSQQSYKDQELVDRKMLINGSWEIRWMEGSDKIKYLILEDKLNHLKQTIISEEYPWTLQIIWQGDIDLDGKLDFILGVGKDHGYGKVLFLSSAAEKGKCVKRVATLYYDDCC